MCDIKDLKSIARTGYYNLKATPVPKFVGESVFITPNMKRNMVTNIVPDDYIVKAWKIPCLIGRKILVENYDCLPEIMKELLEELNMKYSDNFQYFKKDSEKYILSAFRMNHIFIYQRASSAVSEYGKPMYIEILAYAKKISEWERNRLKGKTLFQRIMSYIDFKEDKSIGERCEKIKSPMKIIIKSALWSNIKNPSGYKKIFLND